MCLSMYLQYSKSNKWSKTSTRNSLTGTKEKMKKKKLGDVCKLKTTEWTAEGFIYFRQSQSVEMNA